MPLSSIKYLRIIFNIKCVFSHISLIFQGSAWQINGWRDQLFMCLVIKQIEMQQERQLQYEQTPQQRQEEGEYIAHINELISEPAADNVATIATQYILTSLYQLSSYLFSKKIQNASQQTTSMSSTLEVSFDSYLELMGEDLGEFQRIRATRVLNTRTETINMQAQLIRCYQKVENIYFEENYVLDLSYFEYFYAELKNKKRGGKEIVNNQLEKLCQCLDSVEINLFSQIHCKFEEYFKVVANFQYLKDSVSVQLKKLQASRLALSKVKRDFLQKSVDLRKKILQRQNIQKLTKLIKQIKSIKKLPQVLQSILASSLPYEALSLLQDTKNVIEELKGLNCLKNTTELIRSMEALVQNDLTRRYGNELYVYLEQCHSKQSISLQDLWKKIEVHTCLDKDSSFVLDQLNSSTNSALSDNPQLLEELELMDTGSNMAITSATLIPRHQGKQYQIAMILLQSYKYVNFSPEVTKIKICNSLRIFAKRFEKEMLGYLNQVVESQIQNIKQKDKQTEEQGKPQNGVGLDKKNSNEQGDNIHIDVVDKVSVQFYIKHLGVLNDIFRETITRFLGYLLTLVTEYEQQFGIQWSQTQQSQRQKLMDNHKKFKDIFQEECSLLPSIFKIVEEKIKYLLTLKNISSIDSLQFYRWITTLKYWKRYFDHLVETHPLLNHQPEAPTQDYIKELASIVEDNVRKAIQAMNLQTLLFELTKDYVNVFHKKTINDEIINTLQEETWQSTEIPAQFSDILQAIFNPDGNALNSSVTILDSSTSSSKGILNSSRDRDSSRQDNTPVKIKIKLLKNNMMIAGVRYKVNLSLLVLCQWLGEYMKMARVLANVFDRDASNSSHKRLMGVVYDKLYDLIYEYSAKSRQMILEAKAINYGKTKAKAINAKHICLLLNCLSVLLKIAEEMLDEVEKNGETIALVKETRKDLITKLTFILNGKIDKEIQQFLQADKSNTQGSTKTSNTIITFFLQMVEITDEYLQVEEVKQVLKVAFQTLSQRYLTHLLLKGGKQRADAEVLIEKIKFLRKYFPQQYENLVKEIPS